MPLNSSYLIATKNVSSFFNALLSAQAPEKFTQKVLENLEFKSTNDRLFIPLLKSLGFISDSGTPNQRYYDFLDQSQSKLVLAQAIREAYSDLFAVRNDAQTLSVDEVKNKLKTLTQGQKSEKVISLMASTFKALCSYADWDVKKSAQADKQTVKEPSGVPAPKNQSNADKEILLPNLNYNIQIHLPETRDMAVYDAIFQSLKEHLLR